MRIGAIEKKNIYIEISEKKVSLAGAEDTFPHEQGEAFEINPKRIEESGSCQRDQEG
jgi:hypothetical protein